MCLRCGNPSPGQMLCRNCRVVKSISNKLIGIFTNEFYITQRNDIGSQLFHKYDDGIGISDFVFRKALQLGIEKVVVIIDGIERFVLKSTVNKYLKLGIIYNNNKDFMDKQYILRQSDFDSRMHLTDKEFKEYMKIMEIHPKTKFKI